MNSLDKSQIREIARRNDAAVAIVGNRVYEASKYAPDLIYFTTDKYLLLNHFHSGMSLEAAAQKSGVPIEEAESFIDSPKAVEHLRKLAIRDYIRRDWEGGGKWVEMGEAVLSGERKLSKDQQVVYMAFRDQFMPKPKNENESKTVINFNFTADDVKKALQRQSAIDVEVVQEKSA